jgi:hypothetical protein
LKKIIILIGIIFLLNSIAFSQTEEDIEVNRKILKELALCQCLAQSEKIIDPDSMDASRAYYNENFSYSLKTLDSIVKVVENAIDNSIGLYKTEDQFHRISNYQCIRFYESNYLDSIVKLFDYEVRLGDYESDTNFYKSDSIRYERDFRKSRKLIEEDYDKKNK